VAEPDRLSLCQEVRRIRLPAGASPFRSGDRCDNYVFLLAGRIRVQMVAENGREIVLYRIGPGETCVLTTACLLSGDAYPAEARSETELEALVLPREGFRALLDRSPAFRDFVFRAYGERIASLIALIQEVVFRRLDARLARWLLHRDEADGPRLPVTHQQIAVEVGSAREVVSRQLKEFERRGWLRLGRGVIEIASPDGLRSFLLSEAE
jgi:CRP/FNR family transcriptional regulator, anaerobic regulatory protein